MKLIFCPVCQDLIKLDIVWRSCKCGKSRGHYLENGLNAEIQGKAIPIGIAWDSFFVALKERPKEGLGKRFEAFVIPKECPTINCSNK